MSSSFREAVGKNTRPMTTSESQVLEVLMRDLREAVFLPAATVARNAHVNESTVIRLAQKLGFSGYSELREAMRIDVRDMELSPLAKLVKLTDTRGYDLQGLVNIEVQALLNLPDHISQESLEEAARMIFEAKQIYLYGNHFTNSLITFFDRRLRVLGKKTTPLTMAGRDLAEHVNTISEGDLLFSFALRREPAGLNQIVRRCKRVGATSIVLTDLHGIGFDSESSKIMIAPRSIDEDFRTQVVPHTVCYALILAIYHLYPEASERAIKDVEDVAFELGFAYPNARPFRVAKLTAPVKQKKKN